MITLLRYLGKHKYWAVILEMKTGRRKRWPPPPPPPSAQTGTGRITAGRAQQALGLGLGCTWEDMETEAPELATSPEWLTQGRVNYWIAALCPLLSESWCFQIQVLRQNKHELLSLQICKSVESSPLSCLWGASLPPWSVPSHENENKTGPGGPSD